jgi:hypothetical protein
MKIFSKIIFLTVVAFLSLTVTVFAQTKPPIKKNERPGNATDASDTNPKTSPTQNSTTTQQTQFPYKYEFSQPNFVVSHIIIEHDENGKGTIIFEKKESEGTITDPIQVSAVSLEKIKTILQTLNFIDSTEDYQSPTRDYGHLGNYTITIAQDKKTRTAKYNWTENLDARALTSEYQKISEQYIWIFDMSVSIENQPLEAPSLMDRLDSLLQRNEISDPTQMVPRLKEISNDERIPLLARNHASRIVKSIEKKKEK